MISQVNVYVTDTALIYYVMFVYGGQHRVLWFREKASLRICYIILFECKDSWMLKTDSLIF